MDGSDRIVSILNIKETFLYPEHTIFVLGNRFSKILKILRREQPNLKFSNKSLKDEIICNVIQTNILLWRDELETVIENTERNSLSEKILLLVEL